MNKIDLLEFTNLWRAQAKELTNRAISADSILLTFQQLHEVTLDEVRYAMIEHGKKSNFMPKPAELLEILIGTIPTNSELFDMASVREEHQCTLGRFVRGLIGNVNSLGSRQGPMRVRSLRIQIEDFYSRALSGEYTDSELRMLVGAGVDLYKPIAPGCPKTRLPYRSQLKARVEEAKSVKNIAPTPVDDGKRSDHESEVGKAALAELMGTLNVGQSSAR